MTQYRPIGSRIELHNPRDGPTPENTIERKIGVFIKLFFKKALTSKANIFMKEQGRKTFR